MTAVQRLSPKRNEQPGTIADEASGYFLRPLAAAMVKVAREAMELAAERAMSNARATGPKTANDDGPARPWPVAAE